MTDRVRWFPRWSAWTVLFVAAGNAAAQCSNSWAPLNGLPGTDGAVYAATTWDPDGAGPATPRLVLGGQFTVAGDVAARGIAAYDLATGTWSAFGTGMQIVRALAVLPSGDLVAGGEFATAGGVAADNIARWNGSAWTPIGTGLDAVVHALAVLPSGDLVAGGFFSHAGTVPASAIARWNGASWSSIGAGMNGGVRALTVLPGGDLVAGGEFLVIGAQPFVRIARWNGAIWSAMPGFQGGPILALATAPGGDVLAGAEGVAVQRWNGASWSALGGPPAGSGTPRIAALAALASGDVVAAGTFLSLGGTPALNVARWNGSTWSAFAAGITDPVPANANVSALCVTPAGALFAGGLFTTADGGPANNAALWNGAAWSALGAGMDQRVLASLHLPNGDLVVGGTFRLAGGIPCNRIARFDGAAWHAMGSGMDGIVLDLAATPDGGVLAVGGFTTAGGVAAAGIARWNGTTWSAMGVGVNSPYGAQAVAVRNGEIFVSGYFDYLAPSPYYLGRWTGTAWVPFAGGIGPVDLDVAANGDLIVGGPFTSIGGIAASSIARWDGTAWHALGLGIQQYWVRRVQALPDGRIVALGSFAIAGGAPASGIAVWNGSTWDSLAGGLGGGFVDGASAVLLPDGDLLVGGFFHTAGGVPAQHLARWNGTAWSAVGDASGRVETMASLADGTPLVGGSFTIVGGNPTPFLARLAPSCPSAAVPYGAGCAGSAGPVALTVDQLPWLGGSLRATATGMAPSSLAIGLVGVTAAATPLALVHPAGLPGCSLLAVPDVQTSFLLPSGGTAVLTVPVPDDLALVGLVGMLQVAHVEFDALLQIAQVSSSNGVRVTLGAL